MEGIELGKELDAYVQLLVASGRYRTRSEVLREGVRLIQKREAQRKVVSISTARRLAVTDTSRTKPVDEVFRRLATKSGEVQPSPCRSGLDDVSGQRVMDPPAE